MKQITQIIILFALLLPVTASAYNFEVDGIYYNLYYNEDNDRTEVCVAFGEKAYSEGYGWYSGSVTIPATVTYEGWTYPVTHISDWAFAMCPSLVSVTIPNSVTSIGDRAFYGSMGLSNVNIPSSVTTIGVEAFYSCYMTSIDIPNSITIIGDGLFSFCSNLTNVTIPNSVTTIGDHAFSNCSSLTNIDIPNSVTSIGYEAFSSCTSLTSVTIPNSVTSISEGMFSSCSNLTNVDIPNSVTFIGVEGFSNCSSLTDVSIPNSVTTIGDHAFSGCSGLTSVTIPNSVTTIGEGVFSSCGYLTSLVVADGNMAYDSRDNCNAIIETASNTLIAGCQNTILPSSVTSIGNYAFSGCYNLTSIDIPNSITAIGSSAFQYCSGLTSIDIPNLVTTIGGHAFSNCSSLTNIDIPNSVTSIGEGVFYRCGLTSIDIPNSVTSIGYEAFSCCRGLTSVTIPNSVTSIGRSAFSYCYGLASITIPNSVTSIGYSAFSGCDSLNDVYSYISDPSVITMGYSVFNQYPDNYAERTLHVPAGSLQAYQADTKWNNYFGSIVEMDPVLATSIALNQASVELTEDETLQLTATVLPEEATDRSVTWASSDESVAMVDENGLVTAVAPGAATITATTNDGSDLNASCNVTVLKGIVLVESIQLNVTTAGLNEGSTLQLTATVLPEDCDNKSVIWASNNPSVATVDNNGLVTTHSVGTATITATTTDGSNLSTTCTVTLLPVGVKGDVNGDSNINISDVTKLIDYLLNGTWN